MRGTKIAHYSILEKLHQKDGAQVLQKDGRQVEKVGLLPTAKIGIGELDK